MALFGLGGSKTTVGLDIGSGLIKVVAVDHGKGEPVLAKVGIAPVLQDAIVEGEIMDPGVVSDAIRSALEAAGLKQKKVVAAVGGRDVIIKKIQVDRMKEADAADVVRWEAQQHVPFDIEGVELDFQVLDPEGEGVQMDVLLVAAKRELVENRAALLADAGLDPVVVDVDAFALHNAFEVNYPDAMQGVAAMIHIGHEVTNINILQDGVPLLTRDLSVGTRKFREDLQRDRGMSVEDADRLLQGFERSADLDPIVKNRAEEIGVGVERAGAFLASASREAGQIQRVYCSGGGARIPGLADALSERVRQQVEVADPLKGLRVKDGAFGSLAVDEVAPLLMLAVGLALRKTN
jgi:type IV pilus assembly protein PilM